MKSRTFVLAGLVSALCFGGQAVAESPNRSFAVSVKGMASATQPEKKPSKQAEKADFKAPSAAEKKAAAAAARQAAALAEMKRSAKKKAAAAAEARKLAAGEGTEADRKAAVAEQRKVAAKRTAVAFEQKPADPRKAKKEEVVEVAAASPPVELRSDTQERGLFTTLFGGPMQMLPETRRRDQELREREAQRGKKFKVKADFLPQVVDFDGGYSRGTIVVNTAEKYLYLIEGSGKARRYAIAVGKDGLKFKGKGKIQDKQEWPRWIPTKEMQERDPKKYGPYKDGMPGGPDNPLGARAMYLYQGKKDTHIRIHGTNQPWTIGTDSSNGCFRMVNDHVIDLYGRVRMGADVVVL